MFLMEMAVMCQPIVPRAAIGLPPPAWLLGKGVMHARTAMSQVTSGGLWPGRPSNFRSVIRTVHGSWCTAAGDTDELPGMGELVPHVCGHAGNRQAPS